MHRPLHAPLALAILAAFAITSSPRGAAAIDISAQPKDASGIVGIDGMTATVFEQGQSSFSGMALRLRLRHSALVRNVEFIPAVEYWQNAMSLGTFDVHTRRRDATLGGQARWVFLRERWQPYAGLGVGVHFLDEHVEAPALGLASADDSVVRGAFSLMGGVQFGMSEKLGSLLELEFHDLTGQRQFKVNTGLSWNY